METVLFSRNHISSERCGLWTVSTFSSVSCFRSSCSDHWLLDWVYKSDTLHWYFIHSLFLHGQYFEKIRTEEIWNTVLNKWCYGSLQFRTSQFRLEISIKISINCDSNKKNNLVCIMNAIDRTCTVSKINAFSNPKALLLPSHTFQGWDHFSLTFTTKRPMSVPSNQTSCLSQCQSDHDQCENACFSFDSKCFGDCITVCRLQQQVCSMLCDNTVSGTPSRNENICTPSPVRASNQKWPI